MPELIEEECLAAELLLWRRPVPRWVAERPGWLEAIVATLDWAWRRSGRPPLAVDQRASELSLIQPERQRSPAGRAEGRFGRGLGG